MTFGGLMSPALSPFCQWKEITTQPNTNSHETLFYFSSIFQFQSMRSTDHSQRVHSNLQTVYSVQVRQLESYWAQSPGMTSCLTITFYFLPFLLLQEPPAASPRLCRITSVCIQILIISNYMPACGGSIQSPPYV